MAAAGGVCAALVRWGWGTSWDDLLEPDVLAGRQPFLDQQRGTYNWLWPQQL